MTDTKKAKKLKKEAEELFEKMAVKALTFFGPQRVDHVVKLGPEHGLGPPKKKKKAKPKKD